MGPFEQPPLTLPPIAVTPTSTVQISPQSSLQQVVETPLGSTVNVPGGTLVQPGTVIAAGIVYRADDPALIAQGLASQQFAESYRASQAAQFAALTPTQQYLATRDPLSLR